MRPASAFAILAAIACGADRPAADPDATDAAPAAMAESVSDPVMADGPGACAVLPDSVWHELLGDAYYGPEESNSTVNGIAVSSCKYNFTELTLFRPAPFGSADEMAADLRRDLESSAEIDRSNGMDWKVEVETTSDFGVPAVVGSVSEEALAVYHVHALAADGTLVEVESGDDAETAAALVRRVLAALGG